MAYPTYHERQWLQMCLKHTLNNLFQGDVFVAEDLNGIANSLTPPNFGGLSPHRTPLLGNYDVNVLEAALQKYDKIVTWLSIRPSPSKAQLTQACVAAAVSSAIGNSGSTATGGGGQTLQPPGGPFLHDALSRPDLWAVIVNVAHPSASLLWRWMLTGLGVGGRHWLGLRRFGGIWYNLDSHLPHPEPFDGEEAVCEFLKHAVEEREATILLATTAPGVASDKTNR